MRNITFALFISTLIACCNGQNSFVENRLKTADKFIECLSNNTPDKILEFTYPEVDHKINDKESRSFYVNKAHKFIEKFGLPKREKWIVKFDPQNNFERLLITIPIFKGYDSVFNLLQADIVIAFPPPQISDKIYKYEIVDKYDFRKMKPTLAPQVKDSTRKNSALHKKSL
jgi:hypothetical protein